MFKKLRSMIYTDSAPGWTSNYGWQTCPKCGVRYVTAKWHEVACPVSKQHGQKRIIGVSSGEHMHLSCSYPSGGYCGYEWGVPPRYFTQEELVEFGLDKEDGK